MFKSNNYLTNNIALTILMHFGFWCLVFLWPLLSLDNFPNSTHIINRNWLSTSSLFVIFYINYVVLVDIYFLKNRKNQFYVINLLLIAGVFFLLKYFLNFNTFNPTLNGLRMREIPSGTMSSFQLILPMILSVGMCTGLKINTKWNKNQMLIKDVKQNQLNTEIKYLRYQIQPHFLFNTLNNVYSLIDNSPNIAKVSIHSLSKMMRYLLHESTTNKVPLAKEVEFLERYIDLMQLRISSNLDLEKSFPIINQPIQVAPLLFISFIENAFKHGIDAVQSSFIKISMTIQNDEIAYTVTNSSFPQNEKITDSGIGLDNLKKRLDLLYSNKYTLFTNENNGIYCAKLTLKINDDDA
jgi:sensor histidine kinase YesM